METLAPIIEILAVSDRNNRRDGITGALGYAKGRVLQALEGAPADLDRLLKRLEADPRHGDLKVADRRAITSRMFADWTMKAPRITSELEPDLLEAIETCEDLPMRAIDILYRITQAAEPQRP